MAAISTVLELGQRVAAVLPRTAEEEKMRVVSEMFGLYLKSLPTDWKKYAYFSDIHYTRNLVFQDDNIEVMVLCWKAGQVSRIHDHAGSHCWLGVVDGTLQEIHYNPLHDSKLSTEFEHPAPEHGIHDPLVQLKTMHHQTGQHTYINDRIALHSVGTDTPTADAVSVHLYHPPIKRVKIFGVDHTDMSVTTRIPGYYSKFGNRDTARKD